LIGYHEAIFLLAIRMQVVTPMSRRKRRLIIGTVGLSLGGLAPIVTGIVGAWSYITQGYFVAKTGELIYGPIGLLSSGFFILAGTAIIGYAIWSYRKHR